MIIQKKIQTKNKDTSDNNGEEEDDPEDLKGNIIEILRKDESTSRLKSTAGRSRWTSTEKKLVENYFRKHIKNRIIPKKHEWHQFLSKYGDKMIKKDWVKVKTYVYNTFRPK